MGAAPVAAPERREPMAAPAKNRPAKAAPEEPVVRAAPRGKCCGLKWRLLPGQPPRALLARAVPEAYTAPPKIQAAQAENPPFLGNPAPTAALRWMDLRTQLPAKNMHSQGMPGPPAAKAETADQTVKPKMERQSKIILVEMVQALIPPPPDNITAAAAGAAVRLTETTAATAAEAKNRPQQAGIYPVAAAMALTLPMSPPSHLCVVPAEPEVTAAAAGAALAAVMDNTSMYRRAAKAEPAVTAATARTALSCCTTPHLSPTHPAGRRTKISAGGWTSSGGGASCEVILWQKLWNKSRRSWSS